MQHKQQKYLHDILVAVSSIEEYLEARKTSSITSQTSSSEELLSVS